MSDSDKHATYNGLNRPAMMLGVPLMLLLCVGGAMLVGGFGGIYLWGLGGALIPAALGVFLFSVRVICENDPNATRVIALQCKGILLKAQHKDTITGFSSTKR